MLNSGRWVADENFGLDALLLRLLLQFHVKEPLVDLDTGESSLAHGFFADLTVPLTAKSEEELAKILDLLGRLLLALDAVLDQSCRRVGLRLVLAPGAAVFVLLDARACLHGELGRLLEQVGLQRLFLRIDLGDRDGLKVRDDVQVLVDAVLHSVLLRVEKRAAIGDELGVVEAALQLVVKSIVFKELVARVGTAGHRLGRDGQAVVAASADVA